MLYEVMALKKIDEKLHLVKAYKAICESRLSSGMHHFDDEFHQYKKKLGEYEQSIINLYDLRVKIIRNRFLALGFASHLVVLVLFFGIRFW